MQTKVAIIVHLDIVLQIVFLCLKKRVTTRDGSQPTLDVGLELGHLLSPDILQCINKANG